MRCEGCLERPGPAKALELGRDLGVIQVLMVAATGADQLKGVGVAAFHASLYDADWPAPDACRRAMAGLAA
jgi:hypothetical protein